MGLVQITPEYPPKIGGISDYAVKVAGAFTESGCPLHTIVTNPDYHKRPTNLVLPLTAPSSKLLQKALEQLEARSVLLHFSGYGYAHWGLCYWLVKGLRDWKKEGHDRKLVILFHEVYATGPIWRASFWTSLPQQQIAKNLAQLSDTAIVTSQGGYERLKFLHPQLQPEIVPVFSTVGEPDNVLPISQRKPIAVIFGGAGRRSRTYRALAKQPSSVITGFKQLGITELIDIGPGDCAPQELVGFPVRTLGTLPEATVSDWLNLGRVGLFDYPQHMITKSTIASAYFAHGLLTVNTSATGILPKDLVEGREFVSLERFGSGCLDAQAVASAGFAWYRPHCISNVTRRIVSHIHIG